jgi:thermitase
LTTALTALVLMLGGGGATEVAAAVPPADPESGPVPAAEAPGGRVIVQWEAGTDRTERVEARADAGVVYGVELGDPDFQLVETRSGEGAAAAARALAADPAVALAEPDGLRQVEAAPDDPLFAQQWGLQNTGQAVDGLPAGKSGNDIDVLPAWERTIGVPSVVVADIDTGYRADSPDLESVEWTNLGDPENGVDDDGDGKIDDVHGWDFVGESIAAPTEDKDPTDSNVIAGGHGVHTAGIIGAKGNNGTGISGVAQNVRIMPLRVCTNDPSINEVRCLNSAIVAAINYAGAHGARVANLSLGGTSYSQAEVNAFAANPGTLYVISAGNDGANNDSGESGTKGHHYPCDYRPAVESTFGGTGPIENTICVAALDPSEALAAYSDWGNKSVDIAAPGSAVLSTFPASETFFSDNFETDNFASQWTTFGANPGFGRAGVGDGPLSSFGMTETPGAAPTANSTYGVKKAAAINLPVGTPACRIEGSRFRKGGTMPYGVIVDGSEIRGFTGGETIGASMLPFHTVPILGLGGHSVQPYFEYHASGAPAVGDGLWLDEVALACNAPLSVAPTYAFLDGTSMAAPQVSGAAALLFSLKSTATVAEVRAALLGAAKPVAALAGRTVSGGRLDVAAAMNQLVPVEAPGGGGGEAPGGGTGGGGTPIVVGEGTNEVGTLPPGTVTKTEEQIVTANPGAGNEPTVTAPAGCTVPKLIGKTLGQARAALGAAGCKLGKVTSPKARRGAKPAKLVVRSAAPAAGAQAGGGTVAVALAAKPKRHR